MLDTRSEYARQDALATQLATLAKKGEKVEVVLTSNALGILEDPADYRFREGSAGKGDTGVIIAWPESVKSWRETESAGWYLVKLNDGRGYVPVHLHHFKRKP